MKKDIHPSYNPVTFVFGEGDDEMRIDIGSTYKGTRKGEEFIYRCDVDIRKHRAWNPDKSIFTTDSGNVKIRAYEARFGKSRRMVAAEQAATATEQS